MQQPAASAIRRWVLGDQVFWQIEFEFREVHRDQGFGVAGL
jgi:hypothetical protein